MWNIITMGRLIKLIYMVGFSGILDIGKEEGVKMIKDKLVDGKNC